MATSILKKKIIFRGTITTRSGLHIGGTNTGMEIGGVTSYIVRNGADNKPYIPGSSLKGKMRSLIELMEGKIGTESMSKSVQNGPCMDASSKGGKLFGTISKDTENPGPQDTQRPSRIIVRDAMLKTKENFKHADLYFAQAKTEVVLDRLTAKAMPRTIERVPEGAEFNLRMILNIFEGDDEAELVGIVSQGLRLLQDDYLGGNGSRGYGEVAIYLETVTGRGADYYLQGAEEQDLLATYPTLQALSKQP